MAEPSIINPELFSYFQLTPEIKLKHSTPSLCDSVFNAQDQEKAVDFICCNTQTQVTENHWSKKSSGLISFRSDVTQISLILVDVSGDGTITLFHLDESTNLSAIFGGSGRHAASLTPGVLKNPSVRKAADTPPGSGSETDQSASNSNSNGHSSGASNDPHDTHKNGGGNDSGSGSGNDAGNGNGDNDGGNSNGNGGNGDAAANNGIKVHSIAIHLDDWFVLCLPTMQLPIHAVNYNSWKTITRAMYVTLWQHLDPENHNRQPPAVTVVPRRWYPGCVTPFGRHEGQRFYHFECHHIWNTVKPLIKDAIVIFN